MSSSGNNGGANAQPLSMCRSRPWRAGKGPQQVTGANNVGVGGHWGNAPMPKLEVGVSGPADAQASTSKPAGETRIRREGKGRLVSTRALAA